MITRSKKRLENLPKIRSLEAAVILMTKNIRLYLM